MRSLSLFICLFISTQAVAKSHPFGTETVENFRRLFFTEGTVSQEKITDHEKRITAKIEELSALIEREERRSGERDEKKIKKKIRENDALVALRLSVESLRNLGPGPEVAENFSRIHQALLLEQAVRIEGKRSGSFRVFGELKRYLQTWEIPYESVPEAEATNLYDKGAEAFLGSDEFGARDLSTIDPGPGSFFWSEPLDLPGRDVARAARGEYSDLYHDISTELPEDLTFDFDAVKHSDTKPKIDVTFKDKNGKKIKLKLKLGAEIHADPTNAALTLLLGYGADLTRYLRRVKVRLGKKYKLSDLKRDWEVFYSRDSAKNPYRIEDYILETGEENGEVFVVFREGLVELKPKKISRVGGWTFGDFGTKDLREVRGLTLVQMWLDNTDLKEFENNKLVLREGRPHLFISDLGKGMGHIFGEKPEVFWENLVARTTRRGLVLNYRATQPLSAKNVLTFADARWAARLIGTLSRSQIEGAVRIGGWPRCIGEVVVEKLISRRNDLLLHLRLLGEHDRSGRPLSTLPVREEILGRSVPQGCGPSELEESTIDFDFNTGFLLGPLGKSLLRSLMDFSTGAINGTRHITLSDAEAGFEKSIISQVIVDLRRQVERNPAPESHEDLYIVQDHFELGFRLGVSYGVFKDFVYTRSFRLAYPVRSKAEARTGNGFLVNLFLARDARTGNLPKRYVLHTDHFIESGIGVEVDDMSKPISLSVRSKVSRARILRSVLDHRNPERIIIYRDRTAYAKLFLQTFARVGVLKLPLLSTHHLWGSATGAGFVVNASEFAADTNLEENVRRAMSSGDFTPLASREEEFRIKNSFQESQTNWNLIFWKGRNHGRLQRISVDDEDGGEEILQYATQKERSWNFFGRGEKNAVGVEVYGSPEGKRYQLNLLVTNFDRDTRDRELEAAYLNFINGLAITEAPVIPFTPSLGYSVNGRWGSLVTRSETTYYPEAIDAVLGLTPDSFWRSLGERLKLTPEEFARTLGDYRELRRELRRSSTVMTRASLLRSYGIEDSDYRLLSSAEKFLRNLKRVQRISSPVGKIKKLGALFRQLPAVTGTGFYDPRLLGALHRIMKAENFFSTNVISSPLFEENNTVEGLALAGEIGKSRPDEQGFINFVPTGALELYRMFDGWKFLTP